MKEHEGYSGSRCYFHPKEAVIGVCHLCLNERLLILAAKQSPRRYFSSKSSSSSSSSSSFFQTYSSTSNTTTNTGFFFQSTKPYISLPKIFALGSLFTPTTTTRRRLRQSDPDLYDHDDAPPHVDDHDTTSISLEDESFISIKFGDNGVASWDKTSNTNNKLSLQHCTMASQTPSSVKNNVTTSSSTTNGKLSNNSNTKIGVLDHAKPRPTPMRWRKRIGHLLQVIRWKRYSKASGNGSISQVETVKMRNDDRGWIRTLSTSSKHYYQ